jgi:hypothetical protein
MRKSAAPSVLAKKLQELGKENADEVKSSVWEKAGGNKPRRNFLSSRKKFKTPVASLGLVDSSAPKSRSEVATGGIGSEGFALHNDSKVEKDALLLGRNPLQVLNLINLGREGTVGNKSTSVSDNSGNLLLQSANSLPPSIPDFVPDLVGKSECDGKSLDLPSLVNLKSIPGRSLLSGSSSTLGVKRNCPHDGGFENESHILRKSHHPTKKQGESLLNGEVVRVEKLPEILKVKIVSGDRLSAESKLLNMIQLPLGGTDRADYNVRLESTSSEGKEEQSFYVKEEHNNKEVPLDPKITKVGNTLHGPQSQGPSLHHEVSLKETLRPTQEAVLAEYYLVMYCPRKKNAKRKGPWFDGIIICQGRSCTLQDMDGKVITKANVQGLKDMPEGATLEVNHRPSGLVSLLESSCIFFTD